MIGQVCVKLTGREAGKTCVIVNILDDNFVLIDGNVKRRKCNLNHIEFTEKKLDIKKDASTNEVLESMKKAGIKVIRLKESKKEKKGRPKKIRKSKKTLENKIEPTKNAKTKK
jgi:large subunit ribosomal protein L14e